MDDFKNLANTLLVDLFNHILTIHDKTLKKKGVPLSITEVHVLEAINKVPVQTMSNIAKELRVTVGTLTTSSTGLVKKGYVERYYDEADRRKVFLRLKPNALDILKIHDEYHENMINALFDDLTDEEKESVVKVLQRLSRFFHEKY